MTGLSHNMVIFLNPTLSTALDQEKKAPLDHIHMEEQQLTFH